MSVGDNDRNVDANFTWNGTHIWFSYTVVAADRDYDGVSAAANSLKGCYRPRVAGTAQTRNVVLDPHIGGLTTDLPVIGSVDTPALAITTTSTNGSANGDPAPEVDGIQVKEGDTITVDLQASGGNAAKSINWRYSVSGDDANTDDIEIREYSNTATALTAIPASRNGSSSRRAGADFTTTATRHQLFITAKTDTVADLGESFVITFNNLSATGGGGVVPTPYSVKVSTVAGIDYDVDDDGLIDIDTLAKLDAIRCDPDGNGTPTAAGAAAYNAAFPGAVDDMGCPAYSDDGGSPRPPYPAPAYASTAPPCALPKAPPLAYPTMSASTPTPAQQHP